MKRPILTQNPKMSMMTLSKKALKGACSMLTLLIVLFNAELQAQNCNSIMVCNNGVQISLDDDCNMTIEPDMILEGQAYGDDYYDVEARLPNGTALPQFTEGFDFMGRPIRRVVINRNHIGMTIEVKVSLRGCGNSCWGKAIIEDKLPPVIETCPCEERINWLTGNLPVAGPTYNRPNLFANCPTPTPAVNNVRYQVIQFAVDANGITDILLDQATVVFSLYQGTFDPLNPCTNIIATNTNSFSGALSTAFNYQLVISSIGPGVPFGGIDYSVDIDSRTGNVKSSITATICTVECTGEQNLLAQLASNTNNRPIFRDGCSEALWVPSTFNAGTVKFSQAGITLTGGTDINQPAARVLGAQICYTPTVSQSISFDWTAFMQDNSMMLGGAQFLMDEVVVLRNGAETNLANPALNMAAGTYGPLTINAGQQFCIRVYTNNVDFYSVLGISNVKILSGGVPALTYEKTDEVEVLTCNDRYSKIIKRYWTVRDPSGNAMYKTQFYYIRRGVLSAVTKPTDKSYTLCAVLDTLPNGAPKPSVSGFPNNTGCSNIQTYFSDIVFELCGKGKKIFRQWFVIDWCTGAEITLNQTIRIEDKDNPVLTCPRSILSPIDGTLVAAVVNTKSHACNADWTVIAPGIVDCSATFYTVSFIKAGPTGVPNPAGVYLTQDGATQVAGVYPNLTIINLPLGRTLVRYTVTDACGNFSTCDTAIDVVDKTPPTAICEGFTVVSLDDSGWGVLFATSVDDHSNDNCQIDRFEIRRKNSFCPSYASDTTFQEKINFCCQDVTTPESYITVVLRVYDKAGNFNHCEANVRVQNKRPPVIVCPVPRTLVCGDSRIAPWASGTMAFDTSFFGKPTVSGVCSNLLFSSRILSDGRNSCGVGNITRQWFVTNNPTITCTQVLTVTGPTFTFQDVTFPSDRVIASCNPADAHPDILDSRPFVAPSTCRQIGISYTDQIFYETPEACVKILRTWRVIDWCTHGTSQFIAEKVQTIKLTGSTAPRFTTSCTNVTLNTDPLSCEREVTITVNAEDDCTDPDKLKYNWTLDINNNNSIDFFGTGKTINRILPQGTHRVAFSVENRCGVKSSCTYTVTINSTKKPTPLCYTEVVWVMEADGSTEVWASDFNLKSESACSDDANLRYFFDAAFTQAARTFTCADIPNGQVARIPLKMYVRDIVTGQFDFCDVTLILQDSPLTNACPDNPGALPRVAGKITNEMEEGVDQIEVGMTNVSSESKTQKMTDDEGRYIFDGVSVFDPLSIEAYKNTDFLNGVSTLDLVLIQRHILGIQKLTSPYQLLAADINNSRSITASDLVNLRKLILGVTTEFENNTSWRFVPKGHRFDDPAFPYDFPKKINLDSIFEDKSNVDFIAIKTGDVNNSAKANAQSQKTEVRSHAYRMYTDLQEYKSGDIVKVDFKANDILELSGAQFAIAYDPGKLTLSGFESGLLQVKAQNFNFNKADLGEIPFSYDNVEGVKLSEDAVLFSLIFKANHKGNTSVLNINSDALSAEIYGLDLDIRPVRLEVRSKTDNNIPLTILHQNEPNPFRGSTKISFEIAENAPVHIRIFDITGREVYQISNEFVKGYHSLSIDASGFGAKGVYYYQMESGKFSSTRKMILIE